MTERDATRNGSPDNFGQRPLVLAVTGASGAVYAGRLLSSLLERGASVHFTISDSGVAVVRQELGVELALDGSNIEQLLEATDRFLGLPSERHGGSPAILAKRADLLQTFHYKDYFSPMASGSFLTSGMIVCPCSGSTLSGIAHATSGNLIQRAAEVHLKERRRLILVPRETPLSSLQLENMKRAADAGAIMLPAAPGWYHGVSGLVDLVDFVVGRILDLCDVPNEKIARWTGKDQEWTGSDNEVTERA